MHYTPHAILNCVAWFLLSYGNAARSLAHPEVLSHFAQTIGTVLESRESLANEIQNTRVSRSTNRGLTPKVSRRQVDPRPAPDQQPNNIGSANPVNQLNLNQRYPFQYEHTQQFRYPPYSQQISQNLYPGGGLVNNQPLPNSLPIDPRFFQLPLGNLVLQPVQPANNKPLNTNVHSNENDVEKEVKNNNVNTLHNLDSNNDSKSSAQNRPFDGPEFFNQAGVNSQDPSLGNLRIDNRYSAIDYERIRQNYYSDPPINQQRNYYSGFNDIRLNNGPSYRSSLAGRYPGLDYAGGGDQSRPGITAAELRPGGGIDGIGDNYFNGLGQGPYRPFGSLTGGIGGIGGIGGSGIGGGGGNLPFSNNFGLPFNGDQYSGGFGGGFYSGGPGNFGFNNGDSTLRASASKERVSEAVNPRQKIQKAKQPKNQLADEKSNTLSSRIPDKDPRGEA